MSEKFMVAWATFVVAIGLFAVYIQAISRNYLVLAIWTGLVLINANRLRKYYNGEKI